VNTDERPVDPNRTGGTAAALRVQFDQRFAAPAASSAERFETLLAIRIGGDPYALRLSEIAGLHADRRIESVPSSAAQLLGIVGLRGRMAPVYDLAAILHYPPAANPRWMLLAGAPQPVGFAFETFEAPLQVPESSLVNGADEGVAGSAARQHLRGMVRAAGALRPIIHLPSVLKSIKDYAHE
jgi:chemotaxis signal transduction protein